MKRFLCLPVLLILCYNTVLGQGEIDTESKILYRNEWSLGFSIKNNGIDFDYRSGKFVNSFKKNIWSAGFSTIRHSQEYRRSNPSVSGYGQYCFGKKNFCFDAFYAMGRQRQLFSKRDLNSVEVRLIYQGGASLAFLKPIYYEIYYSQDDIRSEKFDAATQQAAVTLGRSSFMKGFDEISVDPGAFVKCAMSFEFGKTDKRLVAFEVGGKLSAYLKTLEIMGQDKNYRFLADVFISARFGKVFHGAQYEKLNEPDEN